MFRITVDKGSLLLVESLPEDVLDMTRIFMQRYQNYTKASYFEQMLRILDNVNELTPLNLTECNIKLRISIKDPFIYVGWIYTSNGIEFERKRVEFILENGRFTYFINYWGVYNIGSEDVNVDADEAVSIAREALKDIPTLYMRKGNETVAVKPKLGDIPPKVKLITAVREPLTLYPLWHVTLYFDQFYGMYYGVAAEIWADTGEIRTTYPLGFMGPPPQSSETPQETETPTGPSNQPPTEAPQEESQNSQPEENPPNQSTDTQQDQNTNTNITPIIAATTATAAILAVTTITIYKQKPT
ncbi:MAG: hypothetical protein QW146_03190 [Candidatus Bathyarchaeia archaeon]